MNVSACTHSGIASLTQLYEIKSQLYIIGEGKLSTSGSKLMIFGVDGIDQLMIPNSASVVYGNQYKGYWHAFHVDGAGMVTVVNEIVRCTKGAQSGRKF